MRGSVAAPLGSDFARLSSLRRLFGGSSPSLDVPASRAAAERWLDTFAGPGSAVEQVEISRGPASTVITPRGLDRRVPRLLYIHGGGLVYYSPRVFEPFLATLASDLRAQIEVFSYPKLPEGSVDDVMMTLTAGIAARCADLGDEEVIIAGDSVGGLLALYLATRVFPDVFAKALFLYPVLDLSGERASYAEFGEGYFLDASSMRWFRTFLEPWFASRAFDPFELSAETSHLPRSLVVSAGWDVLRDEAIAWVEKVSDDGQRISHRHFADLPHDFCLYADSIARSGDAVRSIADTFAGMR